MIEEFLSENEELLERAPKKRQNLNPKGFQPHKMHPLKKIERRVRGEVGLKRTLRRAGNNAAQRDAYRRSKTAKKDDGAEVSIRRPVKHLGSIVRKPLRLRSRIR